MKAITVHSHGGPEKLVLEESPQLPLKEREVRIELDNIGVNFIDVYHRTGLYKMPLPFIPGMEGAGKISEVGPGIKEWSIGERVAFCQVQGAYSESIVAPGDKLVSVPSNISDEVAAAVLLQGLTAHYLADSIYPLRPAVTALVHAGAGGVGLLLTQIAKLKGAKVFTTVSTEEKATLSKEMGADEVINVSTEDFAAKISSLTSGKGVNVVFDSVGKDTFDRSLASLATRGHLISFGQSSGPVGEFNPLRLGQGSLSITRPRLGDYVADRDSLESRSKELFGWIGSGKVKVTVDRILPLALAAEAHRALESRGTKGKVLLSAKAKQ